METINQRAYAWPLMHGGLSIVRQSSDKKAQVSQREYSKKQDTEAASLSKPGTRNCHSVISTVLYQSNNQNPPRSYRMSHRFQSIAILHPPYSASRN